MRLIDAEFKEEVGYNKIPNAETLEAIPVPTAGMASKAYMIWT